MNLNLGCGGDDWGDIRLDIDYHTQTGVLSKLNIRADAHNLPFKDKIFDETRCYHVLEHCKNPMKVIEEIKRVSNKAILRFPVDDGYKRETLFCLLSGSLNGLIQANRTRTRKAHLWRIRPSKGKLIYYPLSYYPLRFFVSGRKKRFFKRLIPYIPKLSREWEIIIS